MQATTCTNVNKQVKKVLTNALLVFGLTTSNVIADTTLRSVEYSAATPLEELAKAAEHEEFFDLTVANFIKGINKGFEDVQAAGHIEYDFVIRARQIAESVYTSDRVMNTVHQQLQRQLETSDYVPLITLNNSDLRLRERAAEDSARENLESPDGDEIFDNFIETYQASVQYVERSDLIESLHESLKISELMAQLLIDTQVANVIGLSYTQPAEIRDNLDSIIANVRAQQPYIEKLVQAQFSNHQAYIYRNFSTAEIEQITNMYSSDSYKRYFSAVMQGLRIGLTTMSIEFGDKLGAATAYAESSQEL